MPNSARPCRFWNADASEVSWLLDWATNFKLRATTTTHVWVMGSGAKLEYGFVILLEDACAQTITHVFPFGKQIPGG